MQELIKIEIPDGDYCWNHREGKICQYFDNEGGHSNCVISNATGASLKSDKYGNIPKEGQCKSK